MERCTLEKNGFIGIWFEGTKSPEKAIIAPGARILRRENGHLYVPLFRC